MKTKQNTHDTDSQLILVAGFVVAIAVIAFAMLFSGVMFTETIGGQQGLTDFSGDVTQQDITAETGAAESIKLSNLMSQQRGLTTDEMEQLLRDQAENYTKMIQQLTGEEAVMNVSIDTTTITQEWMMGVNNSLLPGVIVNNTRNVTEQVPVYENETREGRDAIDVPIVIDTTGSMGYHYEGYDGRDQIQPPNSAYNSDADTAQFSTASLLHNLPYDMTPPVNQEWHYFDPINDTDICNAATDTGTDIPDNYCEIDYTSDSSPIDIGDIVVNTDYLAGVNYGGGIYTYRDEAIAVVTDHDPGGLFSPEQYRLNYLTNGSNWYSDGGYTNEWVDKGNLDKVNTTQPIRYRYWVPDRLFLTKEETKNTLDFLNTSDRVALIEYNQDLSGNSRVVVGLDHADPGHLDTVRSEVDRLEQRGGTDISEGLNEAIDLLLTKPPSSREPNRTDHIILHTDGFNSDSSYDSDTTDAAQRAANNNITIHTLALGTNADVDLLEDVADITGGLAVSGASDADEVNEMFKEIIGTIENQSQNTSNTTNISHWENRTRSIDTGAIENISALSFLVRGWENDGGYFHINITNTTQRTVVGPNGTVNTINASQSVWKIAVEKRGPGNFWLNLSSDTHPGISDDRQINNISNASQWLFVDALSDHVEDAASGEISFPLEPWIINESYPVSLDIENTGNATGDMVFNMTPIDGNFTPLNNGDNMRIEGECETQHPCGFNNTDGVYSTARVTGGTVVIEYVGRDGTYTREIDVR